MHDPWLSYTGDGAHYFWIVFMFVIELLCMKRVCMRVFYFGLNSTVGESLSEFLKYRVLTYLVFWFHS